MDEHRRELERIYKEHRGALFLCALAVTRSREHAEDAVHDAFCRLARIDRRPSSLKAYVFRAVHNAAVDQIRRQRSGPVLTDDGFFEAADPRAGPAERVQEAEFARRASEALQTLDPDERQTIIERHWGGLSFREIAEAHEIPPGTAASRYSRGLAKLREKMKE
jgi:RNA polymerase sigma-70 factor (ECF subfamily)